MNESARPDWFDERLFPYASHWLDVAGTRVHYVDEGEGPTLLLLHGNPTWSFLYRDLVAGLQDRFRCVALDYPGFGLSEAPDGYGFTIREHVEVVESFVEALDLTDVTLMVQDWGGPIGFAVATRHPERFSRFVVGNTWAWPVLSDLPKRWFSRLLGGPLTGSLLSQRLNLFVNLFLRGGHRRRYLTDAEMAMYRGPFPTVASRRPVRVMPEQIVGATDLLREIDDHLHVIADRPALIVWGTADPAFRDGDRARWEALFEDHRTVVLDGAGHYVQDDAPEEIIEAIRSWTA